MSSRYSEVYRGRTIRVVRDDSYPVVTVDKGNAHLTVAQARRSIDHQRDRSCRNHGGNCPTDAMSELREHGPYAGVTETSLS